MKRHSIQISLFTVLAVVATSANAQTPISKRLSAVGENVQPLVRAANDYDDIAYDELLNNGSIFERTRSEFDPVAIRKGAFIYSPVIGFSTELNDNIFYSDTQEESDVIFNIEPGLAVNSDFERHSLGFQAAGNFGVHGSNSDQNYSDYLVAASGQYDFADEFYLTLQTGHQHLHEERSSPNSEIGNSDIPTEFDINNVSVALVKDDGLINLRASFDYINWDFDDTRFVNNDDRDREEFIESLRVGYDLTDRSDVYVEGVLNQRDYDRTFDDNGLQRSSEGYVISVGSNFSIPSLLELGAYVGYADQDFDDQSFDNVGKVVWGATGLYNVTELTSILGELSRALRDSVNAGTSSYVETRYQLRVEHELMRNLLLNAQGEYRNNQFEGPATNRDDNLYAAGFGAEYFVSREAKLGLNYIFRARDSNNPGSEFSQNSVIGNVSLRF